MILSLLESAVFVTAAWRGFRLATSRPFRRDAAALPGRALLLGVLGVTAAGAGVWLVVLSPAFRHVASVGAILVMSAAWWRARPSYGERRKWPPGSLGIAQSLGAINDRTFYLDQSRTYGPVFKVSQFGRPVVCVVGLARARELLSEHVDSLAAATLPYNQRVPRGTLRYMAMRDHREEAPFFRKTIGSLDLHAREDAHRVACRTMLDTLMRDSTRRAGGVRPREYFARWLLVSLSRVFFGLETDDARINAIDREISRMQFDRAGGARWQRELEAALLSVTEIMRGVAREGADSVTSPSVDSALGAFLKADPAALDDPWRARNFFLVFRIAHGDLTGLLDWLFKMLSDNAASQLRVRAAGRTSGSPTGDQPTEIATRIVLETLRLEQSEFLYRRVVRPITIGEYRIPEGWLLRICVQESHRDPKVFPDPDRFDPDRFLGRAFSRTEYSPFGADERGCMGARLALLLGRLFVEELCIGYEWRVTRSGPLERGSRHRHHWRPSASTRVVMRDASGHSDSRPVTNPLS